MIIRPSQDCKTKKGYVLWSQISWEHEWPDRGYSQGGRTKHKTQWRAHADAVVSETRPTVESGCNESWRWAEVDIGGRLLWMGGMHFWRHIYFFCHVEGWTADFGNYLWSVLICVSYLQLWGGRVQFKSPIFKRNVPKPLIPTTIPKLASGNSKSPKETGTSVRCTRLARFKQSSFRLSQWTQK
jgi:hypothetical protein